MKKIKSIFHSILFQYYKVSRLYTGFRKNSFPFLFLILLISILSIFLREDTIITFDNNKLVLNILFFSSLISLISFQFIFSVD